MAAPLQVMYIKQSDPTLVWNPYSERWIKRYGMEYDQLVRTGQLNNPDQIPPVIAEDALTLPSIKRQQLGLGNARMSQSRSSMSRPSMLRQSMPRPSMSSTRRTTSRLDLPTGSTLDETFPYYEDEMLPYNPTYSPPSDSTFPRSPPRGSVPRMNSNSSMQQSMDTYNRGQISSNGMGPTRIQSSVPRPSMPQSSIYRSSMQQSAIREPYMQQPSMSRPSIPRPYIPQYSVPRSSMQQSSMQQSPMQQSPMQRSSMQQSPMQQSSMQRSSMQQSPMQQSSMQQFPMQRSSMQQSSMQQQSYMQQQLQQSPALSSSNRTIPTLADLGMNGRPNISGLPGIPPLSMSDRYSGMSSPVTDEEEEIPSTTDDANLFAQRGDVMALIALARNNTFPDVRGANMAAENGHISVLEWLAKINILPDINGADGALNRGHDEVVAWVMEHGIVPTQFQ